MAGPATSQPTPQRLAAIRDQLTLLADYLDPAGLKAKLTELEDRMGAPGFWDDPDAAGKVGAEHARASKRLETYDSLVRDTEDLDRLAELAEEEERKGR